MARLLRRTTQQSRLRPPIVTAPPVVFRPVAERLVAVRTRSEYGRHYFNYGVDYVLRPPRVIGAPVVFGPVTVRLADQRPQQRLTARKPHPTLRPPAVVGAPVVFRPVTAKLAPSSRTGRSPHPKLRPPVVVNPPVVFSPVVTKCVTRPAKAHHATPKLRPPAVVGSPVVFAPNRVRTTFLKPKQYRPVTHRLAAPTVIGAASGAVAVVPRRTLLGVGV